KAIGAVPQPMDGDLLGDSLQSGTPAELVHVAPGVEDGPATQVERPLTDVDGVRTRQVAQPLGQIHRSSPDRELDRVPGRAEQDLAALDADVDRQPSGQSDARGYQCETGAYRARRMLPGLLAAVHRAVD